METETVARLARIASELAEVAVELANHKPTAAEKDRLLDVKEASAELRMHEKTLREWDDCPFLIQRGRRKFYSALGIQRWMAEQVTR